MKTQLKRSLCYFFLLFFFLFSFNNLFAQKDYKWDKEVAVAPAIPTEFQDADAVMIYDKQFRQTYLEDYRFFSRNIIKRRIKIQTQEGLEKYARIVIPKKDGMHIEQLDARTIKQDGSIVDLDAKKDIKVIELTDDDDLDKTKYKVFSVPGAAVGDEIEMVCIQEGYTIQWGATVILHQSIPVLESEFSVESKNKGIVILATSRNGMSDGKMEKNIGNVILTWRAENLPGLYEERGNISARTLPHFLYELNIDRLYKNSSRAAPNIKSWSALLHHYNENYYDVRIRKEKKFDEVYEAIMSTAKSNATIHRLRAIQEYINEVKLEKIPDNEASEGVEYFLKKKTADFNTLIKMYKSLLEKMGVDYLFAAGRSKYAGPIDLRFPTYLQITDFLFLVPDAMGNSIILPTKSKYRSYGLNEIPLELYDTDIYIISPTDKKLFQSISLRDQGYKRNLRLRKIKVSVQLEAGTIQYAAAETISGALSTRFRNRHFNTLENEEMQEYLDNYLEDLKTVSIDTFYLSKRPEKDPFRYKLHYKYKTDNQITKLEDNVYMITFDHFLDHYLQRASANRMLDYNAPFAYTDGFSYYLEFDQKVKLSNKENLDLTVKNDMGSFLMNVKQVNPTTLLIKSKYTLMKSIIPVAQVQDLIDLMETAEKADNEGVILELVD
ncbi:MAG: hypothetical protein ACI8YQ_000153 [Polaribacter sp.]|jgi:hypothetical protein